jgi:protein-tyrosine-phosphatase
MKHILFVCTGNTCRSPMAEGIFRKMASDAGIDVEVRSAGVSAMDGFPISEQSGRILQDQGIQQQFASKSVTEELMQWADLILTMTMSHKRHLLSGFPQAIEKTFTLKEYVEDDPAVLKTVTEREQLISELQMKRALSQEITEHERERLLQLEQLMPDYDISDPFGGSYSDYRQCADEISTNLKRLLAKMK